MSVVREDVIKITFDVPKNPLGDVDKSMRDLLSSAKAATRATNDAVRSSTGETKKLGASLKAAAQSAKNFITSLPRNALAAAANKMRSLASGAKNFVVNLPRNILHGIVSGIKGIAKAAVSATKKLGLLAANGLKKLAGISLKATIAGVAALGAGIAFIGKQALSAFADAEQLKGGVETLYGGKGSAGANQVLQDAKTAYREAGLSANEYVETATSFAASLTNSLGGDTVKAAQMAKTAIVDMSDNANKMGSDIESIQNAYNGFAKQNFTMLDNLKLGYGGTQSEMQRLLDDANRLNKAAGRNTDYQIKNYADIVSAIHDVQTQMGIAGATQAEATDTISGSIGMLKGAYSNLIAGLADENADLGQLFTDVTDAAGAVFKNVLPRVEQIAAALPKVLGKAAKMLQTEVLPKLTTAMQRMLTALPTRAAAAARDILPRVAAFAKTSLPAMLQTGTEAIGSFISGVTSVLPQVGESGVQMLTGMVSGVASALPQLIPKGVAAVGALVSGAAQGIPQMMRAGLHLIGGMFQGIGAAVPSIIKAGGEVLKNLVRGIVVNLPELGKALLDGLRSILTNLPGLLWDLAKTAVFALIDGVKAGVDDLSNEGHGAGRQIADDVASGITEGADATQAAAQDAMDRSIAAMVESAPKAEDISADMLAGLDESLAAYQPDVTGQDMLGSLDQSISGYTPTLQSTTQSVVDSAVKEPFAAVDLTASGMNAGLGFANGLMQSQGLILARAQSIATAVKSTINASLDIHSPSRVMQWSGEMTGAGFVKGLDRSAGQVSAAAQNVTAAVRGEMSPRSVAAGRTVRNTTTNSSYSPSFTLNMNGASATDTNRRKVEGWIRDAMNRTFEGLNRSSGYAMG